MEPDPDLPLHDERLDAAFVEAVADAGPHDLGERGGAPIAAVHAVNPRVPAAVEPSVAAAVDPLVPAAVESSGAAAVEPSGFGPLVPAAVGPSVPAPRPWWLGHAAGMAVAGVGGAAIVLTMLVPSGHPTRHAAPGSDLARGAPARVPAPAAVTTADRADVARPAAPAWRATAEWTGGRKKSVAYELTADRPVRIWMHQVTPVLVVRCLAGTLDAFVVTGSASAIEPGHLDHTVRLVFDHGAEATERWTDSADHDGLFAPDGKALFSQLSSSSTLRFTFTPHNAPAAETVFSVTGADGLSAALGKHCR